MNVKQGFKKKITLFALCVGCILCFPIGINSINGENTFALTTKKPSPPIRIRIPKIKVNASLETVGLNKGAVDVPKSIRNAAWFDIGPRPGEVGSAIITGHFGWVRGVPAVFNSLHTLRKGDILFVDTHNGDTSTFVVREIRKYDQNANAVDVFESSDGMAHLNLITCEGIWNKSTKSYPSRLVIFTDKK